jgi:hypothetical protein
VEIENLLAKLTAELAGPIGDDLRTAALHRVRAAQEVRARVEEAAAQFAASEAADAVWLGASLADLSTATGGTRQAARKRWPDLGHIYRTRRWLEGHDADLTAVIRLVLDAGPDLGIHRLPLDGLATALAVEGPPPARWRAMAHAVNRHLRTVAEEAVPTTAAATQAVDGARGTVAHFDAATA